MNRTVELVLKVLRRKVYPFFFRNRKKPEYINDRKVSTKLLRDILEGDKPAMIARYGGFELGCVVNYLGVNNPNHSIIKYIKGEIPEWWWNMDTIQRMETNAGFFPANTETIERYAKLMLEDSKCLDLLGSGFFSLEPFVSDYIKDAKKILRRHLEPDFHATDVSGEWTQSLKGKNVLVIHPFADTIEKQYKKRTKLFPAEDLMPEFNLLTIKAVQSFGGNCEFSTWFEALKHMEDEMDALDYDIAIIGCGAYGFNLAAHAKRTGHKGIHIGGPVQLLFGIKGKRWAEQEFYASFMNENWVSPSEEERPKAASQVEGGCYW